MRLDLPLSDNNEVEKARGLILNCVHCGFCNATCPTYQETGDELDGPRGRIYLIKSLLEEKTDGKETQFHLDRCLTCRNCETTCPSGVQYGELVNLGRHFADDKNPRSFFDKAKRGLIVSGLSHNQPLGIMIKAASVVSRLLPKKIKAQLPRTLDTSELTVVSNRRFVALDGCAQRHLAPQINQATSIVLAALNIELVRAPIINCCGALHLHTQGEQQGLIAAKKAIDGFSQALDNGIEGVVMTASGCGVHVKDYPKLFNENDPYFAKAQRIAENTYDILELLSKELAEQESITLSSSFKELRIAVHEPCTLQHGQKLQGRLTSFMEKLGANVVPFKDSHLCCGSAGSYSLLQPAMSKSLRRHKLEHIIATDADLIVSANVGCILHLAGEVPTRHWIEIVAESVSPASPSG